MLCAKTKTFNEMKFFLSISLALILSFNAFSQDEKTQKEIEKQELSKLIGSFDLKASFVERACTCIDSISKEKVSFEESLSGIKSCIDRNVVLYQILEKADISSKQDSSAKTSDISVNADVNSEEYQKYYYKIESLLMENCDALKKIVGANDKSNENSYSNNQDALNAYNRGIAFSEKNDFKNAAANYKRALKIDSKFAFAWDNLGLCYRKMGKYKKALEAYKNSLAIDPKGMMPLQNIPIVYSYMKKYEEAIAAYRDLEKVDKDNPEVYYGIGHIYFQFLKDYEKSLDNMCKAYRIYINQNSPYRAHAEKIISMIFDEMKKQGKEKQFNDILTAHNFSVKK